MAYGSVTDAILFFDEGVITKEMLFPEFEAVLDGVVQLEDFENKLIKAAFVQIDGQLRITAVVLFIIDFDEKGFADKDWNIPLQHLAYAAGFGPDLGSGLIKLACKSKCPVSWHQAHLWDPDLSPDNNDLNSMRSSVSRNNLGLLIDTPQSASTFPPATGGNADYPVLNAQVMGSASAGLNVDEIENQISKKYQKAHRDKVAQLIRKQRLRISTLKSRFVQEMAEKAQKSASQEQVLLSRYDELTRELDVQQQQNQLLKTSMKAQLEEFRQSRELLTQQIEDIENEEINDLERIKAEYEAEMAERLQSVTSGMQEHLESKDAELSGFYERDTQKDAELDELRNKLQELSVRQSEDVLGDLTVKGVVFVAHHPGVGHITIPLKDIPRYLSNSLAYVAGKCFVSLDQYGSWLVHYESPSCEARTTDGSCCGARIERVESPAAYVHGQSNHCEKHATISAVAAVKAAQGSA